MTYAMKAKTAARMTNTIVTTLYCCLRYAMAPFLTCPAISRILTVPSSFIMFLKKIHAAARAVMLAAGTSQNTDGMLFIYFQLMVQAN